MKKSLLLTIAACNLLLFSAGKAVAQEATVVEEDVNVTKMVSCKDHYYSDAKDNWFIQIGAGINAPLLENYLKNGDEKHHMTAAYNLGFGKWMSPYLGWRISLLYGAIHWDNVAYSKAKYATANFDLMWDMFNSLGGVNQSRVFSIVPFVGLGGTYVWDVKASASNTNREKTWLLPVSAGIQLRFRLCRYVDFFAEGRAQFYGDTFNSCVYGKPVDVNITAIGGFSFNIGGVNFKSYNPCSSLAEIAALNDQINALRADLADCGAALAAAQAQLPCPEVVVPECPEVAAVPIMATVRFSLNSAKISSTEKVNIYNVADWMKANADAQVIIKGYADKDTGTSEYNKTLSEKRAQNVYDVLVNEYGVNPDNLSIQAEGSDTQIYETNNWNRIVIFSAK